MSGTRPMKKIDEPNNSMQLAALRAAADAERSEAVNGVTAMQKVTPLLWFDGQPPMPAFSLEDASSQTTDQRQLHFPLTTITNPHRIAPNDN